MLANSPTITAGAVANLKGKRAKRPGQSHELGDRREEGPVSRG